MSMDIGPGDWVECVDDSPCEVASLRYGDIYCVAEIREHTKRCARDGCGHFGLLFKGMSARSAPDSLCPNRFRPIHRGNTNLIESLKEIAGKPLVCEPAKERV